MPTLEEIADDEMDLEFDEGDFDEHTPFTASALDDSTGGPARLIPTKPKPQQTPSASSYTPNTSKPTASSSSSSFPTPNSSSFPDPYSGLTADGLPINVIEDTAENLAQFKDWDVLYPVYFDKNRSHTQGRRVPTCYAVENPLVSNILSALRNLLIPCILEPEKTHPKDWANPGRIRYLLRDADVERERRIQNPRVAVISNRRILYKLIGEYLIKHPTTKDTPKESPLYRQVHLSLVQQQSQLPPANRKSSDAIVIPSGPKAFPRGWKNHTVGSILPANSPALSFSEFTDDYMEVMAKQMLGNMGGLMPGAGGAGGAGGVPGVPPGMNPNQKPKKVFVRR
ncbi:uncharacterized protein SAPINGB_P000989 [Magnusiomyces paraingens]|uniref:Signal recognition particle SEC65 subunit n=1 Tax=Magnusiomyces paraingens TaxID=2606893 RepID=A0A5E8B3E6_9ASCO|nr:uncharacterized protein SAPINGB_P000989 [Saprochaete ingens]VVT45985.1 unnamed protein product [Saprochaete ingens]